MAWTAPRTWTTGEVVTAAILNTHIRDNLLELEAAKVAAAGDTLAGGGATALSRVAIGAARSFYASGAAAPPGWVGEDHLYPRLVQIDPVDLFHGATGWTAQNVSASAPYGSYAASSGAQNDEIYWYVVLAQGTWDIVLSYAKRADAGIYTVSLDGATVGAIDGYAAASDQTPVGTISGVVVAASGKHTLKVAMASKNASSSGYIGIVQHVTLVRTD